MVKSEFRRKIGEYPNDFWSVRDAPTFEYRIRAVICALDIKIVDIIDGALEFQFRGSSGMVKLTINPDKSGTAAVWFGSQKLFSRQMTVAEIVSMIERNLPIVERRKR